MTRRRSTSFGRTRQVVVIGHNNQVMPTVGLFVGGNIGVRVYTADEDLEAELAPYPGVEVTIVPAGYAQPPEDLPEAAYFICVDKDPIARTVRDWLPDTVAVFHLGHERKGKTAALGFLSLAMPQSQNRQQLLRRLSTLRRVDRLRDLARNAELPLILMYGDPDPDAIGAALGLATIWRSCGACPIIRYTGEVQRYQNKLLINYLKEPIERLREGERLGADITAVVDAQPLFWPDEERRPHAQVIIDHHPKLEGSDALYCDIREDYGSTSTILTEYLQEAGLPLKRKLATCLLYGLCTDTADLQRNTHSNDIKVYDILHAKADNHFLSRLNKSQVPMSMLDYIAWGIGHRLVYRDVMLIHFGEVETPDVLVQVADQMLLTCGINWVVCAGKIGDKLVVVFRGDGHRQDVGARAKSAFGKIGSAGGHRTMGRAEIHLEGEHVDATVDLLIDNLFKKMGQARRLEFIRILRNHLHGPGPLPAPAPAI